MDGRMGEGPGGGGRSGARVAAQIVRAYHARSSHSAAGFAPGPALVDWDAQPSPFRRFEGAPRDALPLSADLLAARHDALFRPGALPPAPLTRDAVALLLELSLGLSGWKALGPDRWSLRCAPSSGNLHPVEGYVVAAGVEGIAGGLHHYCPEDHALEHRCAVRMEARGLWLGLSVVHWREAWKYGLRAFRYCRLDAGHAAAAVGVAAAALGWSAAPVRGIGGDGLAALLGTDRDADFEGAEPEEAELLIAIRPGPGRAAAPVMRDPVWAGRASRCDPRDAVPVSASWPEIDLMAEATRAGPGALPPPQVQTPAPAGREAGASPLPGAEDGPRAASVILGRRSARRFTAKTPLDAGAFAALTAALRPERRAPWDLSAGETDLDVLIAVHRVEGLAPGLYALPRPGEDGTEDAPALRPLLTGDARKAMRRLSCGQGLAAEGAATVILGAPEAALLRPGPAYRRLHHAAGMLGHALYLAAERQGIGASGIGCFLDEDLRDWAGLAEAAFRPLYLLALGHARPDPGLTDAPGYPGRRREEGAPLG